MEKSAQYEERLQQLISNHKDISHREISGRSGRVCILYIKQLTDQDKLSDQIIQPLQRYLTGSNTIISPKIAIESIISAGDCRLGDLEEGIHESVLEGMTIILFYEHITYNIVDIKNIPSKATQDPEFNFALKGGRDAFVEKLDNNVSLIRYRIKDSNLKIHYYKVGRRTKTSVVLMYINDVINDTIVKEIDKRIKDIDVDGIVASGKFQQLIERDRYKLFPQSGIIERPDVACGVLLEGKAVLLVEGSGIAIVAPKVFCEFLWASEDVYDNPYFGFASKVLRLLALFFSISLSALFIIVTSFSYDLLPPEYIIILSSSRANVPFNSLMGVLLLEGIIELLREALLRIPRRIGPAVGIVGATIIGQAAISSGVFSPLLLILISVAFLSSFVLPDYTLMNSLRFVKFFLIIFAGVLGIFGFAFGLCIIMTKIISANSFGIPYFAPFAPYNNEDIKNMLFYNSNTVHRRPHFLRTKDETNANKK